MVKDGNGMAVRDCSRDMGCGDGVYSPRANTDTVEKYMRALMTVPYYRLLFIKVVAYCQKLFKVNCDSGNIEPCRNRNEMALQSDETPPETM
jgi:hypothetical protein